MPTLTYTEEFATERAQRRIDYDLLFGPRVTPEWVLNWEQQVLDECRASLAEMNPSWQSAFERRVAMMNAAREVMP